MPVTSVGENKYSRISTDDWSHRRDVSYFAKKSDAAREFMLFKARAEKLPLKRGYKLVIVQRDRGELTPNYFMYGLGMEGLELNLKASYMPQQDGVAETSNRIIIDDLNIMID